MFHGFCVFLVVNGVRGNSWSCESFMCGSGNLPVMNGLALLLDVSEFEELPECHPGVSFAILVALLL